MTEGLRKDLGGTDADPDTLHVYDENGTWCRQIPFSAISWYRKGTLADVNCRPCLGEADDDGCDECGESDGHGPRCPKADPLDQICEQFRLNGTEGSGEGEEVHVLDPKRSGTVGSDFSYCGTWRRNGIFMIQPVRQVTCLRCRDLFLMARARAIALEEAEG